MVRSMTTDGGKALYPRRRSSVETTFGCIQEAMGFRVPRLRGLAGVQIGWQLVCLAWNLKRAFNLLGGRSMLRARNCKKGPQMGALGPLLASK